MRLIDADKLNFKGQKYNKSQMKAILDFMDAQPTAYDVDKVVKELREWSVNATILELHNNELGEYEEECKRDVICTLNAIDIVQEGVR